MSELFITRESNYNLINFQELESNSRIWHSNYLLQGTLNMEPDSEKIRDIGNIKQIFKRNKYKNGSVMSAHVECAKRTFNVLAL